MPKILRRAALNELRYSLLSAAITLAGVGLWGCNSGPARVNQAAIDAGAGDAAIDQYDTNGDGKVAGDELEKAPGLKAALATTDKDKDGGITADELNVRIGEWQATRLGLANFGLTVTQNGKPLEGANVTLEPEAFLGDELKAAVATTDFLGTGGPSIPKDQRPDPATSPPGVSLGLYKVKISRIVDGKETIPTQYNESTTLGLEVAPDTREILNRKLVFALKTK